MSRHGIFALLGMKMIESRKMAVQINKGSIRPWQVEKKQCATSMPPINEMRNGMRGRRSISCLFPPDSSPQMFEFFFQVFIPPVQVIDPVNFCGSAFCHQCGQNKGGTGPEVCGHDRG